MRRYDLVRTQVVPVPVEQAFAFFADARNLEAITPPWLGFRIVEAPDELAAGARLRYRLRLFGAPLGWVTEITGSGRSSTTARNVWRSCSRTSDRPHAPRRR